MNTALSLEIYRGIWFIAGSEDAFKNLLRDAKTAIYNPAEKLNTFKVCGISAAGAIVQESSSSKPANKIAVTDIRGVITKSGGASSRGMQEISSDMIAADNDPEVIGHFVKIDSPGGSEAGMRYMKNTMRSLKKPKVTLVTRQGMAASGGFGILTEGDYVMAESGDAEIGCHGVMWGVSGVPNGKKDGNGEVHFVVISDTSPNKNKATLDAINNNDTSLMQKEVNTLHVAFRAETKAARPNITEEQMSGGMFPASEVVGTMIDAIGSEKDAINKILELSKTKSIFNPENKNSKAMNKEELKAAHPELYATLVGEGKAAGVAEGLAAGVAAEQERVAAWQVFAEVDAEAVNKGIASGKAIAQSEVNGFLLKAASSAKLDKLKADAAAPVVTPESEGENKTEPTAEEKEFDATFGKYKIPYKKAS